MVVLLDGRSPMSYVNDLAKDRDKYLLQRNQLVAILDEAVPVLDMMAVTDQDRRYKSLCSRARKLLAKIEQSDPIANLVNSL